MGVKTAKYLLQDALAGIGSAKILNLIAVATISVSMFIFSVFLWGVLNLDSISAGLSRNVQMTVYLEDGSTEEERLTLLTTLQNRGEIQKVDYLSKEQAMAEFRQGLKGQEAILDGLTHNPLPASFEVRFRPEFRAERQVAGLAAEVEGMAGVEEVQYGREWLENLSRFIDTLSYLGILLAVGLALSVTFIVANTVRLTVYSRVEEVEIMKLIGATDSFIRWPFLIEGGLQGMVGAVLALAATFGFHHIATVFVASSDFPLFQGVSFRQLPALYSIAFVAGGTLLGFMGSFFSIRKFFRN